MAPPAVHQFRKWLTIWSDEPAELQDANEKKRCAAILEGGLNGRPAGKALVTQDQKNAAKEKHLLQKRQQYQAMSWAPSRGLTLWLRGPRGY